MLTFSLEASLLLDLGDEGRDDGKIMHGKGTRDISAAYPVIMTR